MDTIFINSENSKTSDPHRLLLNLTDKINLSIYYIQKNVNKVIQKQYI